MEHRRSTTILPQFKQASARAGLQRGTVVVLFALFLIPMLGIIYLVITLASMHYTKTVLQDKADATSLAAASALNGMMSGINTAVRRARHVATNDGGFEMIRISWSDDALTFGANPDGDSSEWLSAGQVNLSNVKNLIYAKVDSSKFIAPIAFIEHHSPTGNQNTVHVSTTSIAGRVQSNLLPFGVCALNNEALTKRENTATGSHDELVEHGYRRGVSYNLLGISCPCSATPNTYLIDPFVRPPANATTLLDNAKVESFVCSGQLAIPKVENGDEIYVSSPFPTSLIPALNTRFGQRSGTTCSKVGAPADQNIRDYPSEGSGWFGTGANSTQPGAKSVITGGRLATIAEVAGASPGTVPSDYGYLWSFARPMRYHPTAADRRGAEFRGDAWPTLYPVATGTVTNTYPDHFKTPYLMEHRMLRTEPSGERGQFGRRVLYVPLLQCPVTGNRARVLGIGQFLMVRPATASPPTLYAEFGGLIEGGATGSLVQVLQ